MKLTQNRRFRAFRAPAALVFLLAGVPLAAQTMSIEEYEPRSTLVVPEHRPLRAKYPFIDVHNHQETAASASDVASIVRDMDTMNMKVMVNLSGGSGEALAAGVRNWSGRHPGRFLTFANLDFSGIDDPGWVTRAAASLERDVRHGGAKGLKIFKNLGLTVQDREGRRVAVDDPRLDPIFEKAPSSESPFSFIPGNRVRFSSRRTSTTSAGSSGSSFPSGRGPRAATRRGSR